MDRKLFEVVVLGGGISGLTAAWCLKKAGVSVRLIEAGRTVGGCTQTQQRDGFLLEKGPFNVVVRDPTFEDLLADLSSDVRVIVADRAANRRYLLRAGRLHAVPSNPAAMLTTPLLGFTSRFRLMGGLVASKRGTTSEQTIEQAAIRRLGREVTDTFVSSAVAGIFSGDISKLSLQACFPSVAKFDREARSPLLFGLRAALRARRNAKSKRPRRWRGLISLDGGLGALTGALGRRLGDDCMTGRSVESVRRAKMGFEVTYRSTDAGERDGEEIIRARRVVSALPASHTARILEPLVPAATAAIKAIECASLVVLNLGFRRADVTHDLKGFGFLVPHNELAFPLLGVLWASSVFPHHACPDHCLFRAFVGGSRDPSAIERLDEDLLAETLKVLRGVLGLRGDPVLVDICRHRNAIPQYHLGHQKRIAAFKSALSSTQGLYAIGNYIEGVSINGCIRSATNCASQITRSILNDPKRSEPSDSAESAVCPSQYT